MLLFLVQTPAPVHEIEITRTGANWASVSWKLPTASVSSYITHVHINIYRNNEYLFNRQMSRRTQFNITGLNSSTWYIAGIATADGSIGKELAYSKKFKTKEAGI